MQLQTHVILDQIKYYSNFYINDNLLYCTVQLAFYKYCVMHLNIVQALSGV